MNSRGTIIAFAVGGLLAAASLTVQQLSSISDNAVLGITQEAVMCLLIPGLIGSMVVSGNVHAFHLWVAAVINGLFYFGLVKFIYWLKIRSKRKNKDARG
ncbi:MAG TPA: hypothetical protein VMQ60_09255 [Acidobacteriaceae bacterium]|nr:hypothetical protein [Acidobacteriaceae bacterium]